MPNTVMDMLLASNGNHRKVKKCDIVRILRFPKTFTEMFATVKNVKRVQNIE